jgi:hypothetical protein
MVKPDISYSETGDCFQDHGCLRLSRVIRPAHSLLPGAAATGIAWAMTSAFTASGKRQDKDST